MITFRGEHTGSIMMFDTPALKLLRIMGTSGHRKGALMAEDVPAALTALEEALTSGRLYVPSDAEQPAERDDDPADRVSLAQRAIPLRDLLRLAVATESYITWEG